MKTSELTGALLDFWVAKVHGLEPTIYGDDCLAKTTILIDRIAMLPYRPSTSWACGGPIIAREKISVLQVAKTSDVWEAMIGAYWGYEGPESDNEADGPTPLIAAMRALVASKYGDEVPEVSP